MTDIKKHITTNTLHPLKRFFGDVRWLALWMPLSLIVPNVVLSFTESVSILSAMVNLLMPLGVYLLLMAAWRKPGIGALVSFPFMIFAAFQIVLLYLYGGSVIAVDMFLNVVTTNVSEATELLANLLNAMTLVVILYIPLIVWGICAVVRKQTISQTFRRKLFMSGLVSTVSGCLLMVVSCFSVPDYNFVYETFPVNAVSNLIEACHRYDETSRHHELSADFSYGAISTRRPEDKETYIFVIGETSRGDNWQLGGYDRPTNPSLSREEGVVFFQKSISESNTTHKSVPMLMSFASAENFDSIARYKSIITAFKEAGFHTAFISNQLPNRSYTEHFGNEADTVVYVTDADSNRQSYDAAVFAPVNCILADTVHRKKLIVIHSYGSHFKYHDRYPEEFSYFTPDNAIDASVSTRRELMNAYDNTIRYTDYILASLIETLKTTGDRTALLYASDHGEDIFDDKRRRFLHASPVPTYWQIHQATLVWLSPKLTSDNPEMAEALRKNGSRRVSPQKSLFQTAMQLAGLSSPLVVDSLSLVSPDYHPANPVYLDDLNRPLPLDDCGLTESDLLKIKPLMK